MTGVLSLGPGGRLDDDASPVPVAGLAAMEAIVRAKRSAGLRGIDTLPRNAGPLERLEWVVGQVLDRRSRRNGDAIPLPRAALPAAITTEAAGRRLFPRDWALFHYLIAAGPEAAPDDCPPLPVNFSGWFCVLTHEAKCALRARFDAQVAWAARHGISAAVGAYLASLAEDEWVHADQL